jgi:hypothetical protein
VIKPPSPNQKTPIDYAINHAHGLSKYVAFHYLDNPVHNNRNVQAICTACNDVLKLEISNEMWYLSEAQIWDYLSFHAKTIMEFAEKHQHEKNTAWEQQSQSLQNPLVPADPFASYGGLGSLASGGLLGSTSNPSLGQYADYTTVDELETYQNTLNAQMEAQLDIINASLQVVPPGHKVDSVFVDQSVAKEIAKLSDFNVDIQGKVHAKTVVSQYRALCSKCQASHPVTKQELTTMSEDLREFCREHAHKTEVAEPKTGRKFKDA